MWVKLRGQRVNGLHFRRQVPIGRYVVDFACLKQRLIVEIDGGRHSFENAAAADRGRDLTLRALGFRVQRFWNAEVDADLDAIIETILAAAAVSEAERPIAAQSAGSSLPAGEGRLGRQAERGGEPPPKLDAPPSGLAALAHPPLPEGLPTKDVP